MSFRRIECFVLDCDGCERPWDDGYEGGIPHFETETEGIEFARRRGWVIVGDSMRCETCAHKADCEATGHQYGEWQPGRVAPDVLPHRTRWCEHCNTMEYDPPFGELVLFKKAEKQLGAETL